MNANSIQTKINEVAAKIAEIHPQYMAAYSADVNAVYAKYGTNAGEFKNIPLSSATAALEAAFYALRAERRLLEAQAAAEPKPAVAAVDFNPWKIVTGED